MVDLNNPFGVINFDPETGRRIPGESQRVPIEDIDRALLAARRVPIEGTDRALLVPEPPEPEEAHDEYAWDNLNGQERAIWASVFGVAFNHALVSGDDEAQAYGHARERAQAAVRLHRR